jgi:hypothetical protein
MRLNGLRCGGYLSILVAFVSLSCGGGSPGEDITGSAQQALVPSVALCDVATDRCTVALTVPVEVDLAQVALSGAYFVGANDRVNITSSTSGGLPTLVTSEASGSARIGADATVGHVWSRGKLLLENRATVKGQVILGPDTPNLEQKQEAVIVGGTVRRPVDSTTHTIWSFSWPTETATDIQVNGVASTTLTPGVSYENVFVREKQVLKLDSDGTYFIKKLTLDSGGKLEIANGVVARLALAEIPILNGDVVVDAASDGTFEEPSFLMAVLSSGWVSVSGTFQGLLAAPAARIIISGYGGTTAPLPHRGAFFGLYAELHQGAVLSQGVNKSLFLNERARLSID